MLSSRVAIVLWLVAGGVFAADARTPKKPAEDPKANIVFMDPDKAGIDYAIQGEYQGSAGGEKWGAQVIALGGGTFHAVFEPGGLPGDGWDAHNRYESEGELADGKVTLKAADDVAWNDGHIAPPVKIHRGFDATIAGDTLTARTDQGVALSLKKVIRHSPAEGAKPPAGALALFDGTSADAFNHGEIVEGNLLKEGGETRKSFTDYTLHVEFYLPFKPYARRQERGNSGIYNQHRYEIQVLDTFGLKGMDNQCGGAYTQNPPLVNMCYPPLTWQTYDIEFKAARYEGGVRASEAEITVKQNGILVQDHYKLKGPTGAGRKEIPTQAIQSGPLYLQDHGNPVYFRNVWIVEKK